MIARKWTILIWLVLSAIAIGWALSQTEPPTWAIVLVVIAFTFWGINYWYSNFHEEEVEEEKFKNPYKWVFFGSVNAISILLLLIGFIGSFLIYSDPEGNLFEAIGLIISIIWATIFLRYFVWALYYYNINYGLTDNDWKRILKARDRRDKGELVTEEQLEAPQYNPYRSQTFGLPPGTVRGMIAFTLLFGAISMLVVSMGADGELDNNSFFWDHFEFFKTAFLMMIAFYFGDRSLKYLQKRWNATRVRNEGDQTSSSNESASPEPVISNDLQEDDVIFQKENGDFQGLPEPRVSLTSLKETIAQSEKELNPSGLIPIIDAGHGGIKDGVYTTGNNKMYTFKDVAGFTPPNNVIYEGVINRKIGAMLIDLLKQNGIPHYNLTVNTVDDVPLSDRVARANDLYRKNKNYYYLSIHSNAFVREGDKLTEGKGSTAHGFEIFTSPGQTKSDDLAKIAAKWYMKDFPDFAFRKDLEDGDEIKEARFYVLRKTSCPAFLVENLFFTNPKEAKFLLSEAGQMRIATCLYHIINEIYYTEDNGIIA